MITLIKASQSPQRKETKSRSLGVVSGTEAILREVKQVIHFCGSRFQLMFQQDHQNSNNLPKPVKPKAAAVLKDAAEVEESGKGAKSASINGGAKLSKIPPEKDEDSADDDLSFHEPVEPTKKPKKRNAPRARTAPKREETHHSGSEEDMSIIISDQEDQIGQSEKLHDDIDENPLKAILLGNLNQSHNTQRRRDIKQNYKAKLPLNKLIIEHEKKQGQLMEVITKREEILVNLKELWDRIGYRQGLHIDYDLHVPFKQELFNKLQKKDENQSASATLQALMQDKSHLFKDQTEVYLQYMIDKGLSGSGKTHWDFLLKEMAWMADDFDKETKKKVGDAKKMVRNTKKHLHEKQMAQEKQVREIKIDLKRKSKYMSSIVQMYWKSCEKIVRHNYNVEYERKRQQVRTKKLENFVSKHLKLSVKVAETLNTKQFVEKSALAAKNEISLDESKREESVLNESKMEGQDDTTKKEEEENSQDLETVEMAQTFQPTGHTLDKASVTTRIPFLLKGSLREYQIIGLDWMVTLHNRKLNGILADEMGLGKTIQTIALLASLACDKGVWGPHLIVVPTTIIMNWEMEFKRWCPGFKILTYFGSQKERKIKRHGWSKENSFHVCITSYKLVIQDHFAFRRKKWYYMILDEAQNIKNFKSQRWQTLLRFNTKRRLLLTGTPLQNDVMELWSLMHFLMPNIFSNMQDFKEWFSNPFTQSINQNKSLSLRVVQKLQSILRPFLLRRMKRDVEKQLPEKIEHIIQCNLSRRQRLLYDEYINHDKTRNILADSDFFSIMSVLMQLRKVCNHPDLFEARTIESPFILTDDDKILYPFPSFMVKEIDLQNMEWEQDLSNYNFRFINNEAKKSYCCERQKELLPSKPLTDVILHNKELISQNESIYLRNNRLAFNLMTHRPFAESYAVQQKHFTDGYSLHDSNCRSLSKTIPKIMPFDSNQNYRMQYHQVPDYLQAACIPFSQNYYSLADYDQMRYSGFEEGPFNPVSQYISAIQEDEQKQMMVNLMRKLTLWHAMDKRNRFQILNSSPVYGSDLRQAINVSLVCSDIFEAKQFKYLNWKNYRLIKEKEIAVYSSNAKPEEVKRGQKKNPKEEFILQSFQSYQMFAVPGSVLNSFAQSQMWNHEDFYQTKDEERDKVNEFFGFEIAKKNRMEKSVCIQEWPMVEDSEIEKINESNLMIKEITNKTREALEAQKEQARLLEEHKEREIKMKQPKRVTRKQVTEKEVWADAFTIVIDMQLVKKMADEEDTQQVEIAREEVSEEQVKPAQEVNEKQENGDKEDQDVEMQQEKEQEEVKEEDGDRTVSEDEVIQQSQPAEQQELEGDQMKPENTISLEDELKNNTDLRVQIVEEKVVKKKRETQTYEEVITYEEFLMEQAVSERDPKRRSMYQQELDAYNNFKDGIITDSRGGNSKLKLKEDKPQDNLKPKGLLSISYKNTDTLRNMIMTPIQRAAQVDEMVKNFKVIVPKCVAKPIEFIPSKVYTKYQKERAYERFLHQKLMQHKNVNQSLKYSNILFFPHRNLIQYDCGKLQKMAQLLKQLYNKGSKVIIFTQMTKMLDIFEQFLNLHGYIYVRLDGSVKTENRQKLVDRFNFNKKIFCFISSTRCGGVGINLTGADCVIFYDTDWNPAMDKQAQDRCHRIGQTRTVHIYRLISVNTIEENIFKKSLQKRELGGLIIEGNFNQEFFQKVSVRDILSKDDLNPNQILTEQAKAAIIPRRVDIFKDENIVFDDGNIEGDIILRNNTQEEEVENVDDNDAPVDFEANSEDMEIQAKELERRKQIEQYRRRFEEALIRIEDQEDVQAMQFAKQEIIANDDQDMHEFVEVNILDENEDQEGNDDAEDILARKQKEQQMALELQRQKEELLAKQKINDGISLTQGEMKKHEEINWNENPKLNEVTKSCLNFLHSNFSFNDYLDDRAKKDSKFVHIADEENKLNESLNDAENKEDSEQFSLSEPEADLEDDSKKWDSTAAEASYKVTKQDVCMKLFTNEEEEEAFEEVEVQEEKDERPEEEDLFMNKE